MKFSVSISSVNVTPADLVTFTEEILNRKLDFLCGVKKNFIFCVVHNTIRYCAELQYTLDYIVSKNLVDFGEWKTLRARVGFSCDIFPQQSATQIFWKPTPHQKRHNDV